MFVLRSPCLSPFTPNSMLEMLFRIFWRRASMSTGVLTAAPSTLNLGARGLSKSDATFCPSPVYPIVICRNAIKACTLKFYVRHNCSTPQQTTSFLHLGRWMVSVVGCSKNMFKKAQLQKRHELFSHRWVVLDIFLEENEKLTVHQCISCMPKASMVAAAATVLGRCW